MSSESDTEVLSAIQSRFEVAIPELPDVLASETYSMCIGYSFSSRLTLECSDSIVNMYHSNPFEFCGK